MDEKNGVCGPPLRFSEDVGICEAIEISSFVLDPGVVGTDFVIHFD